MKHLYSFFVLFLIFLAACTSTPIESPQVVAAVTTPVTSTPTALILDTPTNTPTPIKATPSMTLEPTRTSTAAPTDTATWEVQNSQPETVYFATKEDAADGQLAMDLNESHKFYTKILEGYLKSGVNDAYFFKNFGIGAQTANALTLLMAKLKEKNYIMPEGLINYKAGPEYFARLKPMPEFDISSIEISILIDDKFNNRVHQPDPNINIEYTDFIHMTENGVYVYGFRTYVDENTGTNRLNLIFADVGEPGYGLKSLDLSNPNDMPRVNTWINFFPYILKQMKYTKSFPRFYPDPIIDLSDYFWNRATEDGYRTDGLYDCKSLTPEISPVVVATK